MSYLSRAVKNPRTDAGYCITGGNIAVIDFGTASVSLAFTTKGDQLVNILPLDTQTRSIRVPNIVLLKKEGCKIRVGAFGADAKKRFVSLRSSDCVNYIYFERIKMLMRREQAVDRQTLVESFSGEKYYLVEVIAFILQYLKDLLINHFSRTVRPLKTTDFDWVITVPAIWDARGKRMMREAAYLAGLLTESGGINHLTAQSCSPIPPPDEVNPDKLSLALEPESAAIYSQEVTGAQIEYGLSKASISRPTKYMVIYIGGGTVDITAHTETFDCIRVENTPTGNAWGGTQVNKAFSQLLQKLVHDPDYKKFLASGEQSRQMAIINSILYAEFEEQKVIFGDCKSKEMTIELHPKFANCYDKEIVAKVKEMEGIDYEDYTLFIDESVVESHLFGPALRGIINCIEEAIKVCGSKIDTFYLVGGFGSCKYIHEKVTAAIKEVKGSHCNVIVPVSPHLAVATGAAMWRKNPGIIKARRSDATYGIPVTIPFNSEKHDEHYKYFDDEEDIYRCKNVFCVFLEKGEMVNTDEVISIDLRPASVADTQMFIDIYSTPNVGTQYTVDKKGNSTVTKIGQLVLDVPNPDNLPKSQRLADISMDFSGTEIQAKAKYVTRKEVKTVCDFLSA
ncbi:PREDICTED: heat shock 70 kDa protein 12A-like [Amphimedon queenslandica]|uniref:Uncharacterized protein n=1 Tax=Amphimedon queenslandica TaxID=400682 RepID=A0A1X7V8Y3_AMPQE|nr:PREDICTED: heat shock 70 kDa protein 12A-like [Amphimedon queenslandica]|eukprot:XP_019850144.1 PREDICTED: heat shock 70 kDa protein 12A-like [Amphimedon queenslandica]